MKLNYGLWALLFVIGVFTAGFLPAILLTVVGALCTGGGAKAVIDHRDRKQLY